MRDDPGREVADVDLPGVHQLSEKVYQLVLNQPLSQKADLRDVIEETKDLCLDGVLTRECL